MNRSALIWAVRGLHFVMVHMASLTLGAFFWFTLTMMAWHSLPPAYDGLAGFLHAAAPYFAALTIHLVTLWYLGLTIYVMEPRSVIAALGGALVTYGLMVWGKADPGIFAVELAGTGLQAAVTTVLYFVPGWLAVQLLRPRLHVDPDKERIRVPITLACYFAAIASVATFIATGERTAAVVVLLAALAGVFVAVHWVYQGRARLERRQQETHPGG